MMAQKNPIVTITMEDGSIMKAELYPDIAPESVNNFISLIKKHFYDGVIFHRVIQNFMIQGGDPEGTGCNRYTYDYDPIPGLGHFLHTYVCNGNPVIPTFQGEPERVAIPQDMDAFANMLWNNLNVDNKISLFVRYTDLATGEFRQKVINRYE